MAKKHTPNTVEYKNEAIKHLQHALDCLENADVRPLRWNEVDTHIGLAASRAVTVNYYAKETLSDETLSAMQSLTNSKLPSGFGMAYELNFRTPADNPADGVLTEWLRVARTYNYESTRIQLIADIQSILGQL